MIYSEPTIDLDGTIYIGSDDHKAYAINPDGTKKWETTLHDIHSVRSPPTIGKNGLVYFVHTGGDMHALSRSSGVSQWSRSSGGWTDKVAPAIGNDGTVYFCGGGISNPKLVCR